MSFNLALIRLAISLLQAFVLSLEIVLEFYCIQHYVYLIKSWANRLSQSFKKYLAIWQNNSSKWYQSKNVVCTLVAWIDSGFRYDFRIISDIHFSFRESTCKSHSQFNWQTTNPNPQHGQRRQPFTRTKISQKRIRRNSCARLWCPRQVNISHLLFRIVLYSKNSFHWIFKYLQTVAFNFNFWTKLFFLSLAVHQTCYPKPSTKSCLKKSAV